MTLVIDWFSTETKRQARSPYLATNRLYTTRSPQFAPQHEDTSGRVGESRKIPAGSVEL